jgi:hypothetical protein
MTLLGAGVFAVDVPVNNAVQDQLLGKTPALRALESLGNERG